MWRAYTLSIVYFEEMEKFINNVKKRPPLWDTRIPDNYNRPLMRQLWSEVEDESKMEAGSAAKKFKSLKDTFRREYRKAPEESKWIYFKQMYFLKDVIGHNGKYPISTAAKKNQTQQLEESPTQADESGNEEGIIEIIPAGEEFTSGSNKRRIQETSFQTNSSEKRSKTVNSPDKYVSLNHSPKNDNNDDKDDDYHFLMSCRKYLKSMPAQKKLQFRIKMQELLYKFIYSDDLQENDKPSCSSANTGFKLNLKPNENIISEEIDNEFVTYEEFEDIKPDINVL